MTTSVARVNSFHRKEAEEAFLRCCGSHVFASKMESLCPFASTTEIIEESRRIWSFQVPVSGWLEAFSAHPRIGNVEKLREKFGSTAGWCEGEQSTALQSANEAVLQELADWNNRYEAKFGHIFIICASGRTSSEVLHSLKERYPNRPIEELQVAASEQQKITELRLEKLFSETGISVEPCYATQEQKMDRNSPFPNIPIPHSLSVCSSSVDRRIALLASHLKEEPQNLISLPSFLPNPVTLWGSPTAGQSGASLRPPITTHVLDASLGSPASGIEISLEHFSRSTDSGEGSESLSTSTGSENDVVGVGVGGERWSQIGKSKTDNDGRSGSLMTPSSYLAPGVYRLTFQTMEYFSRCHKTSGFYPEVTVTFVVTPSQTAQHFHVPVLLSPFSYTTYRGS